MSTREKIKQHLAQDVNGQPIVASYLDLAVIAYETWEPSTAQQQNIRRVINRMGRLGEVVKLGRTASSGLTHARGGHTAANPSGMKVRRALDGETLEPATVSTVAVKSKPATAGMPDAMASVIAQAATEMEFDAFMARLLS